MKEIVIRPKKIFGRSDLEEIWKNRELFYIFVWRDIKVRYKQTLLGIAWVVFQPLLSTLIFTIFFGNLAKVPSGVLPYALFVLCGITFWTFFSGSVTQASSSLLANQNIIKKIYFPKIILPLASVITNLVDLGINLGILLIFGVIFGHFPNAYTFIIIPVSVFVAAITAASVGMFLSSVNVKYRDVGYILPFFIQISMFLTPVIFSVANMSERNKFIMALNPMTFVIESARFMFSGQYTLSPLLVAISLSSATVMAFFSVWYFNKTEQFFSDIV